MNELLDYVEDDNDLTEELDLIIHPPGDGDNSDEEDGDEDQPRFQNLPGTLLNALVETQKKKRKIRDHPSKGRRSHSGLMDPKICRKFRLQKN